MSGLMELSRFGLNAADVYLRVVSLVEDLDIQSNDVLQVVITRLRDDANRQTDHLRKFRFEMMADLLHEELARRNSETLQRKPDEEDVPF